MAKGFLTNCSHGGVSEATTGIEIELDLSTITTGKGMQIDLDALTTGTGLELRIDSDILTTGYFLRCLGGASMATEVFAIADGINATESVVKISSVGALAADKAALEIVSDVAACNADSSVLRVEQTATDGVAHCATVKQDDIDKCFINFEGATAADYSSPISTEQGDGAVEGPKKYTATAGWLWIGMVRCAINGTKCYIPYYEEDPS